MGFRKSAGSFTQSTNGQGQFISRFYAHYFTTNLGTDLLMFIPKCSWVAAKMNQNKQTICQHITIACNAFVLLFMFSPWPHAPEDVKHLCKAILLCNLGRLLKASVSGGATIHWEITKLLHVFRSVSLCCFKSLVLWEVFHSCIYFSSFLDIFWTIQAFHFPLHPVVCSGMRAMACQL